MNFCERKIVAIYRVQIDRLMVSLIACARGESVAEILTVLATVVAIAYASVIMAISIRSMAGCIIASLCKKTQQFRFRLMPSSLCCRYIILTA